MNRPTRATRLVTPEDVPALAALLRANRAFLAPFEPPRDESYYTDAGQRDVVRTALDDHQQGRSLPHVILDGSGEVVGRITLNTIVRGPFQSCSVGYWLAEGATGRGLASGAVQDIKRVAFDDLGLHRIEAATLLHNTASQRVLQRTGFARIGLAPEYLNIGGRWQDHLLFQVLATDTTAAA